MFKVIEDLAVADQLWEAGLLWRRWLYSSTHNTSEDWELDASYEAAEWGSIWSPTKYGHTDPDADSEYIQYGILIEE